MGFASFLNKARGAVGRFVGKAGETVKKVADFSAPILRKVGQFGAPIGGAISAIGAIAGQPEIAAVGKAVQKGAQYLEYRGDALGAKAAQIGSRLQDAGNSLAMG